MFYYRWVVLEFAQVITTGVGAALPLAITLICKPALFYWSINLNMSSGAQHLVLSTQRKDSDHPSTSQSTGRERSRSLGQCNTPRSRNFPAYVHNASRHNTDVELQSGVFVVTETYTEPPEETKSKVGSDLEAASYDDSHRKPRRITPSVSF